MGNEYRPKTYMPQSYQQQFGYGVQPGVVGNEFRDPTGKLNRSFDEINRLFEGSGDALIGTDRTGIASGLTLAQSMDSMVQSIVNDRGFIGNAADYVLTNTKNVATMEFPGEVWASGSTTVFLDYTSPSKVGKTALRVQSVTATAGYFSGKLDLSKSGGLDLTRFNDGSVSDNGDFINFSFYVNSTATIGSAAAQGVIVYLSPTTAMTSYFSYVTTSGLPSAGWNFVHAKKSDFAAVSGVSYPSWSAITRVQCTWWGTTGSSGNWVNFDDITLIRKDPKDNSTYNPFQRASNGDYERDFYISSGEWYCGESEPGLPFIKNINPTDTGTSTTSASLIGQVAYSDFIANMTVKIGQNGYTNRLSWQAANDKRVNLYVNNNVLNLSIRWGTVGAVVTTAFTVQLSDTVRFILKRRGSTFIGICERNGGELISQLILNTNNLTDTGGNTQSISITEPGYLCVSDIVSRYTAIYDLEITTTELAAAAIEAYSCGGIPGFQLMSKISTEYVYYINPTSGSDENDGMSATGAFKSWARMRFEPILQPGNVLCANQSIILASGVYPEPIIATGMNGVGTLGIYGENSGVQAQYLIADSVGCYLDVTSVRFITTAAMSVGTAMYLNGCAKTDLENCVAYQASRGIDASFGKYRYTNCKIVSCGVGIYGNADSFSVISNCTGDANSVGVTVREGIILSNGSICTGTVDISTVEGGVFTSGGIL